MKNKPMNKQRGSSMAMILPFVAVIAYTMNDVSSFTNREYKITMKDKFDEEVVNLTNIMSEFLKSSQICTASIAGDNPGQDPVTYFRTNIDEPFKEEEGMDIELYYANDEGTREQKLISATDQEFNKWGKLDIHHIKLYANPLEDGSLGDYTNGINMKDSLLYVQARVSMGQGEIQLKTVINIPITLTLNVEKFQAAIKKCEPSTKATGSAKLNILFNQTDINNGPVVANVWECVNLDMITEIDNDEVCETDEGCGIHITLLHKENQGTASDENGSKAFFGRIAISSAPRNYDVTKWWVLNLDALTKGVRVKYDGMTPSKSCKDWFSSPNTAWWFKLCNYQHKKCAGSGGVHGPVKNQPWIAIHPRVVADIKIWEHNISVY